MPKIIELIAKKSALKSKTNSAPSLPNSKSFVDLTGWLRKDTHEDPRINSLMRIIRWQGRFIVLAVFLLIISVSMQVFDLEFKLPNQTAIQTAPPIEINDIDYNALAFQNGKQLSNGSTVSKPQITILGQIFDGKQVLKQWPEIQILVNNASIPIIGDNSQYKITLNLQHGPNVIETAFRLNGVLYNRRQRVINYQPNSNIVTPTSSNETISTQATVPASR